MAAPWVILYESLQALKIILRIFTARIIQITLHLRERLKEATTTIIQIIIQIIPAITVLPTHLLQVAATAPR